MAVIYFSIVLYFGYALSRDAFACPLTSSHSQTGKSTRVYNKRTTVSFVAFLYIFSACLQPYWLPMTDVVSSFPFSSLRVLRVGLRCISSWFQGLEQDPAVLAWTSSWEKKHWSLTLCSGTNCRGNLGKIARYSCQSRR